MSVDLGGVSAALVRAVVWGAKDAVLPAGNAEALAGRVEVRVVDDAGHMGPNLVVEAGRGPLG